MARQERQSTYWHRVKDLKLRLRAHARIHRQEMRGRLWYVLQDNATGRYHRFSPEVYLVIGLLDGERTVAEVMAVVRRRLGGEGAPSQDDVIRLLAQLHGADVLHGSIPPDAAEIWLRGAKQQRHRWLQQARSPLAIRLPIFDPERTLNAMRGVGEALFSAPAFVLWLVVVGAALVTAGLHWQPLTENLLDRALSTENLFLIGLVFPVMKLLHEFGHGLAVKRWGGEVHDMGVMILVFLPIPYVDASSASAFRTRGQRVVVAAAGMYVELFVASLALLAWANLELGLTRSLAFNAVLVGSLSTLVFNANPLLRFDGYFILSDLIEISNLGQRSNRYGMYLVQRYLLDEKHVASPVSAPGEARWFAAYVVLSFCYRMFLISVIALAVAQRFFFVGAAIAIWVVVSVFVTPIIKAIRYLMWSPLSVDRRTRGGLVATCGLTLAWLLLFVLPFPLTTQTEGVVWVPDEAEIVAGIDGFVTEVVVVPGERVIAGDVLIRLEEPGLVMQIRALEARLRALEARLTAESVDDRVAAGVTRKEKEYLEARLTDALDRAFKLEVRSPGTGGALILNSEDLPGSFVHRGQVLAYLINPKHGVTVRAIVRQDDIGLLRDRVERVDVRLAQSVGDEISGRLVREVPTANTSLPSLALSTVGGGTVALDPSERGSGRSLRGLFHVEIQLSQEADGARMGARVYVRFVHGTEPAGFQIYRRLRQLFLRRLNV